MHSAIFRDSGLASRRAGRCSTLIGALVVLAAAALGQPQPMYPDLVLTWGGPSDAFGIDLIPGHAFLDPYPTRYRGMRRISFRGRGSTAGIMDLDNSSALMVVGYSSGNEGVLTRVGRDGTITSIRTQPAVVSQVLVASSGDYLIRVSDGWGLIHPDGSNFRLLFNPPAVLTNAIWDEETGDLIATGGNGSQYLGLLRCTMRGVVTTVSPSPPTWWGPAYDPRTGDFFATASNYPSSYSVNVARIPRAGGPFSTIGRELYGWQLRLAPDGDLYAAGPSVIRLRRSTQAPWPAETLLHVPSCNPGFPCGSGFAYMGIEMDRSRNLSGRGAYGPGSAYQLVLSFPKDGLMAYQGAASLGIRPGLQAGPHWIPLNPDALFAASLTTPSIFSNFSGVLSAGGDGSATVNIPNWPALRGVRIFLAFVTWRPGQGIRTVSNVMGITIGANI